MKSSNLRSRLALLAGAGSLALALGGCTTPVVHLSQNYGASVDGDARQQITNPDPHYLGVPAAGSSGPRTQLAQDRYVKDKVIPPVTLSTTNTASVLALPPQLPAPADQ
jgi:hypothetical protein